jgi:hypothetical protein
MPRAELKSVEDTAHFMSRQLHIPYPLNSRLKAVSAAAERRQSLGWMRNARRVQTSTRKSAFQMPAQLSCAGRQPRIDEAGFVRDRGELGR